MRVLALQEVGHNQAKHLIAHMLEPLINSFEREGEADRQWHGRGGVGVSRKWTELFVIWAWILRGVLKYVRWAGSETTVGKDPRLDLRRVDLWEGWKATGSKVRPGLAGHGGSGGRMMSVTLGLRRN